MILGSWKLIYFISQSLGLAEKDNMTQYVMVWKESSWVFLFLEENVLNVPLSLSLENYPLCVREK